MENKKNSLLSSLNYNSALIGYSGVVGSSILNGGSSLVFYDLYNSSNIETISGSKVYDLVVCSAPSANKLLTNKYPEQAYASLEALKKALSNITLEPETGIFILISSFDAVISPDSTYGAIRKELEEYVLSLFGIRNCIILRLPSLIGTGVNKGFGRDLFTPYPLYLPKGTYQELQAVVDEGVLSAYYAYNVKSELYKFTGIIEDEGTSTKSPLRLALQDRGISPLNFYHSESRFVLFSLDYLSHLLERIFMVTSEYGIPALRFILGSLEGTSSKPLILNLANSSTTPTVGEYAKVIGLYPNSSYLVGSSGYVFGDNKGIPKIDYASNTLPLTTISSCLLSLELA